MKTDRIHGRRTDEGLAFWKKKKDRNPAVGEFAATANEALKKGIEPDQLDVRLAQKGWMLESMRFFKADGILALDLVASAGRTNMGTTLEEFVEQATKAGVKKLSTDVSDIVASADFEDDDEPVVRSLMESYFDDDELVLDFGSIPTRAEQKRDARRRKTASFLG